ncbi:hypothetical protein [Leptothermofonsia sp. ETS-13]|uniref:hypothetical protein n=1 Tax=Leptothermofonsia sp. ETS-13 TaxID=3035696 RepID=UPI003BA36314
MTKNPQSNHSTPGFLQFGMKGQVRGAGARVSWIAGLLSNLAGEECWLLSNTDFNTRLATAVLG